MKRKVIYLYKETHLPTEGWLQGCFICDTITSKTEEFKPVILDHLQKNIESIQERYKEIAKKKNNMSVSISVYSINLQLQYDELLEIFNCEMKKLLE